MKLHQIPLDAGGGYFHWCPGCGQEHHIAVEKSNGSGARWSFNGNLEVPTFDPSIKITWYEPDARTIKRLCHYFIRNGEIQFCSDSTHKLSGQTVSLPDIPAGTF